MKPKDALAVAIKIAGNQSELARKMGGTIRQQHVSGWVKAGRVPAERCAAIERATEGKVTRAELRPDLFGDASERAEAA